MGEFLAASAKPGEPVAYVDVINAFIYVKVARPSPCLRAPAGRDLARDMPSTTCQARCQARCHARCAHCSQMQATNGDVEAAVMAFREVRAQAPPCRAGRMCW